MPNQRKPGQTLVAFPLDDEFLAEMDRARGETNRSAFVREAIFELLKSKGIHLDPSIKAAPDRAGKGGRKPKNVTPIPTQQQEQSSKVVDDATDPFISPPAKQTNYRKGLRKKPE